MGEIARLLLCSCEGSQSVDAETANRAVGAAEVVRADRLCMDEAAKAEAALGADGEVMIACGQMASFFADLAEDLGAADRLVTCDIRDRAGWTDAGPAHAKQAALLAAALQPAPETPVKDVVSEGTCLVLGAPDVALETAARLAETLAVTCLLTSEPEDLVPPGAFDVALGRVGAATGALGGFELSVDGYRQMSPAGRGAARFAAPVSGARSRCDIILDLRGEGPLFPADHKREGYLRADAARPAEVARAVQDAAALQGVFEKPLYIRFDAHLCAHSRAGQPGCDRCLSVCPTGAIAPDGDTVAIDPDICAGCGACAAVCPSGAASYDDPPVQALFSHLRLLATTYAAAGGAPAPRALFHDPEFGAEMIGLLARFGRGLPPEVIPVEVPNVEGVGHAEMLAALAVGFSAVHLLATPRTDRTVPLRELDLARAIAGDRARLDLLDPSEPDALDDALRTATGVEPALTPILPLGGRRDVTRLAAQALRGETVLPLPGGAPYGAVEIDPDACTLCLACVSLCPVGALGDNPDRPEVRFQEAACLQCGICETACPEDAIALVPRLDTTKAALEYRVLNGEDPFECISCGKPFGVKSTIERIVATLEGKHWMYSGSDNVKLIQMCDDCRINAQYHQDASPFRMGERPRVRTTDDYLKDRKPN